MARPLHSHAFHKGEVPLDQLAGGTATAGYAPISNGDGTATWGPAGSGGGLTILGPFTVDDTGDNDLGVTLAEGDVILQAFAVTKTDPTAPIDGDTLEIFLVRDAGGQTALTTYDLFNATAMSATSYAYFGIGHVAPWLSSPDLAYIDWPRSAVIRDQAVHLSCEVTVDSDDGEWDIYVVMQPA